MKSIRLVNHRAHLGSVLRRLHQKNQALFAALSVDSSITSMQAAALCVLHDEGPLCLTDLGMATGMDLATVRGVVIRLQRNDWVELADDPNDKRRVIVNLCQKGADYVLQMQPVFLELNERSFEPLNPAERIALDYLLRKMIDWDENTTKELDDSATPSSNDGFEVTCPGFFDPR